MKPQVSIGCGPPHAYRPGPDDAVVVVDVIRAMTTAVTAALAGARCLPMPSLPAARARARTLARPLLVGEVSGVRPPGFDHDNSPAELARRRDLEGRPVVLLSSSGTPLLISAQRAPAVYPGCLRNRRSLAHHLARRHTRVMLLGAPSRGEFRDEDQLCCASIAELLVDAGFAVADEATGACLERWRGAVPAAFLGSKSVDHLVDTGQLDDLAFILEHIDDVNTVHCLRAGELVRVEEEPCKASLP